MTSPTFPSPPQPAKGRTLPQFCWPLAALAALLAFNALFTPGFFTVDIRAGALYGAPIDILNHGAKIVILAVGMTLVIATRGVDLSVGAVMAIAGAIAATLAARGYGLPAILAASLAAAVAAGLFNGFLVSKVRIQPIVATLVLMVCGRGIAQLITGGQIITFEHPALVFLGNGRIAGLPFPVILAAVVFAATLLLTRRTALGLFIEAVGGNPAAARASGISPDRIRLVAYTLSGLCAGIAGLIAAANIKAADANHAGLLLELDAILAVVLGGTALTGGRFHLFGSVLGAILIQTLTTTLYMRNVSSDVAPVPKAIVVLLVCLLLSPPAQELLRRFTGELRSRARLGPD